MALGGWGAMLLGVTAQVIVMVVALELDPSKRLSGWPTVGFAALLAVIFAAILDWMADSGTEDTFIKEARRLMRGIRRRQARQAGGRLLTLRRPLPGVEPGLLMVQLDGVSEPVLRWAVRAGNLPTIGLSNKEFSLLRVLASDPIRVFTKKELLEEVWGYRTPAQTRTLDSHASRLRRKLDPEHSRYVVNCWGVGYRLIDG